MGDPITEYMDVWTSAQVPKKTNGGRGRSSNGNGQGIYGIKKLRELILELAVRGRLVPQDPRDEPAGVLLEKIAEEKKRLVKEGKIKRQKALPEIGEEEKSVDIPSGWSYTRLGSLINLVSGQHLKPQEYSENKEKDMVPYLTGPAEFGDKSPCPTRYTFEKRAIALKGNILLTCKGSGVGKVNIAQMETAISRQLMAIQPLIVDQEYVLLLVQSLNSILRERIVGIAIPGISREDVTEAIVKISPLPEQHRIVAKVDELMALCDQLEQQQIDNNDTHQTLVETLLTALTSAADPKEFADTWQRIADHFDILFTTEQSIDQLKQTILQLAVMGKLVPQDPNDLPAPQAGKFFVYALECEDKSIYVGQTKDVLKRWKEHATGKGADWTRQHPPVRLVHWEEYSSREEASKREKELKTGFGRKWLKRELAAGRTRQAGEPAGVLLKKIAEEKKRLVKEGKIKKQKALPEIGDDEKPFELPGGWNWCRLDDLALNSEAGWSPKCKSLPRQGNDWGVLKVSAVSWGHFKPDENKALPSHLKPKPEYEVMPGDFLISRANTSELVARAVVVPSDAPKHLMLSDKTIRFVFSSLVNAEFICLYNSSQFSREYYSKVAGGTSSSMKNVSREQIRSLLVALPPRIEQNHIVSKVFELLAICDVLKMGLYENQTTQIQLADAIVEKAVKVQ